MSEAQTVESFASLLAQADQPEQSAPADSGPDALPDGEEGLPDAATDAVDAEQSAADGVEGQPEQPEQSDSERVIEWQTASGEQIKATEAELKAGYMREKDYTQKTQAVAEDRKRAQTEIQQQAQIVQALAQNLGEYQAVQHQLQQYQGIDWRAWHAADPSSASGAYIQYQELAKAAEAKKGEVFAARQKFESEQAKAMEEGQKAAEKRLAEKFPGVGEQDVAKAFGTLRRLGGDSATVDAVRTNPALVEALFYAQKWLDLQAKKPTAATAVKSLPPVATKARPAAAPNTRAEAVLKTLNSRRTLSTSDFAQLLKATR